MFHSFYSYFIRQIHGHLPTVILNLQPSLYKSMTHKPGWNKVNLTKWLRCAYVCTRHQTACSILSPSYICFSSLIRKNMNIKVIVFLLQFCRANVKQDDTLSARVWREECDSLRTLPIWVKKCNQPLSDFCNEVTTCLLDQWLLLIVLVTFFSYFFTHNSRCPLLSVYIQSCSADCSRRLWSENAY